MDKNLSVLYFINPSVEEEIDSDFFMASFFSSSEENLNTNDIIVSRNNQNQIITDLDKEQVFSTENATYTLSKIEEEILNRSKDASATYHASETAEYGVASKEKYGHVKIGEGFEFDSDNSIKVTLDSLKDINIPDYSLLTSLYVLSYNSDTQKWEPKLKKEIYPTILDENDNIITNQNYFYFSDLIAHNSTEDTLIFNDNSSQITYDNTGIGATFNIGNTLYDAVEEFLLGKKYNGGYIGTEINHKFNIDNITSNYDNYGTSNKYGHIGICDDYNENFEYDGYRSVMGVSFRAFENFKKEFYYCEHEENLDIIHNTIYRGEELLSSAHFGNGANGLANLAQAVYECDFKDIYIGDTITVQMDPASSSYAPNTQTVKWVVMGINSYKNIGSFTNSIEGQEEPNHLVLVPLQPISTVAPMGTSSFPASYQNGYINSMMYTEILPSFLPYVSNSLGNYLISHQNYFSDDGYVDEHIQGWTSASWQVSLLSAIEVLGAGSKQDFEYYDVGAFNNILPGFLLNPDLVKKGGNWWLLNTPKTAQYNFITSYGTLGATVAIQAIATIVPKVLFGIDNIL